MGILARMRGKAKRDLAVDREAVDGLGASTLAVRVAGAAALPATAVPLEAADGAAWAVHAAPVRCLVTPFAAAPEIGLRLDYCFDRSGNPQRFALLLAAEADAALSVARLAAALQEAVQGALQIGALELPPCTTDEEWHAFRAGLNELVYTRFGLVVEDCVPVDLHPGVDFAAQLGAAAAASANRSDCEPPASPLPDDVLARVRVADLPWHGRRAAAIAVGAASADPARTDAAALRRLFLELPALAASLRALPMQEGDGSFAPMQEILRRLALAALGASTMPSLTHAAPGRRLPQHAQLLRAMHSQSAQAALDEGWALLAAMRCGLDLGRLDDIERMLANLEYSLAQRRAAQP